MRLGIVVFDTKKKKAITPSVWKKEDGVVSNIRWVEFKDEKIEKRHVGKKLVYKYDKNRRRLK